MHVVNTSVVLSTLCLLFVSGYAKKQRKLVIDQDAGSDDAMAIFMALLYEQYFDGPQIVAITISHGNVNESQAFYNTQRVLNIANRRDVPIYRGVSTSVVSEPSSDHFFGTDGLGDTKYESDFKPIAARPDIAPLALIELSKKYKGELEIVALGADTNIAIALRLDPTLLRRVKQLYIAAGTIQSNNLTKPEYNVLADVEAYKIIMEVAEPSVVTLIPYSQVIKNLGLSWKFRKEVLGKLDNKIMKAQNSFDQIAFNNTKASRFQYLDPAAMAIVLDQDIVSKAQYSRSDVLLSGQKRGCTTTDFVEEFEANVRIFMSFNKDKYKQILMDIFSKHSVRRVGSVTGPVVLEN